MDRQITHALNTSSLIWILVRGLRCGESIAKIRLLKQLVTVQEKTVVNLNPGMTDVDDDDDHDNGGCSDFF